MEWSMQDFWRQMTSEPLLGFAVLLCAGVILVNGWTDAPNAIATCVVTRSLSVSAAIVMAAVFNFLGVLVMSMLNATVAQTIADVADFGDGRQALVAMAAALLAIVLWATLAWTFGIPTSESHALVAGLSGSAVALHGGLTGLCGDAWGKVLIGLLLSVGLGFSVGFWLCRAVMRLGACLGRGRANRLFGRAEILGAAAMSFMHGAQDGQKFMGVLLLLSSLAGDGRVTGGVRMPLPILLGCSLLMALGTSIGGKRIIKAMGQDMVRPERYQGVSADLGAALTLLLGSLLGIPLSTTHVKTTALMGAGASRRLSAVKLPVVGEIALTWLLTFPGCGLLGYIMTKLFLWWF